MNVSTSHIIYTPPEKVFEFVANVENERRWRENTIKATLINDQILKVGTIGESTIKSGKSKIKVRWKVFELEQDHFIRWDLLSGPLDGTGGYLIESTKNGTRFTLEAKVRMKGISLLMSPLVYLIAKKLNSNSILKLKSILEP